jgi:Ca2+-binding RTX toxin-like protein
MRRGALTLLITCGASLGFLLPGAAPAAGETVVTYAGSPGTGSGITVTNLSNVPTLLDMRIALGVMGISSPQGVTVSGPHCTQQSPTQVDCQAQGLNQVDWLGGNGPDRVLWTFLPEADDEVLLVLLRGFGGQDNLAMAVAPTKPAAGKRTYIADGGAGRDTLIGRFLAPAKQGGFSLGPLAAGRKQTMTLEGGPGSDTLRGGAGPQRLFGHAHNDRLSGGSGRDLCNGGVGKKDRGRGCEVRVALEG